MNKKQKSLGFTLIESLVVVTMMMVIIAAAVGSYSAANKKNRDNKRMADLDRIRMALEMYRQTDVGGSYPANDSSGQAPALMTNYLDAWPIGPKGLSVGDTYFYTRGATRFTYTLRTMPLETTNQPYSVSNP